MAHAHTTPRLSQAEDAPATTHFCLADDAYRLLNPRWQGYQALEKLSDPEVIALFQQLTAVFIKVEPECWRWLAEGIVGTQARSG